MTQRIAPLAPLAALLLAACAEPAQITTAGTDPQPQQVQVVVSPKTATVTAGAGRQFAAAVSGTANTAVTWSLQEGASAGAVDGTGLYTAPAAAGTFHLVATSVADPTRSDVATVTVTAVTPPPPPPPVTVTIGPRSGTVDECRTLSFQATVTGSTNTAVTWTLQEGTAAGTIDATGLYTAAAAGTYHVVATSAADPTASDVVPVTVSTHVLGVAVSPSTISVPANGTATFTANVTTTCGTFASLRTVNARGEVWTP